MAAILTIAIIDLSGPMKLLCDLLLPTQADLFMVLRGLGAYQLIAAVKVGQICVLERDHEAPVVVPAELEGWTACKQPTQ
jgi:hypothetical protein